MEEVQKGRDVVVLDDIEDESKLQKPPKYAVIFHNDDYTPMEFVATVLMQQYGHSTENATRIMLDVHERGLAVAGIYTKDIAETKAAITMQRARLAEHPLLTTIEPA